MAGSKGGDAARDESEGPGSEPPEHPLVAALREDPASPATPTVSVTGLFGRSDDPEKRRVYLSPELDSYAEFRAEDVVLYEPVALGEFSAPRYEATRVTLKAGSTIDLTDSVVADDQFDLDIRLGGQEYTPDAGGDTQTGVVIDRTMGPPTRSTCTLIVDRTMTSTCLQRCAPPR